MTIPLTQAAIAQSNLDMMIALHNQKGTATSGVWYPHVYVKNYPCDMRDSWWHGYAPQEYFQRGDHMKFVFKEGKSAFGYRAI